MSHHATVAVWRRAPGRPRNSWIMQIGMDHHWVSDGSGRRHRITVIMESRRNGPQLASRHDDDDDDDESSGCRQAKQSTFCIHLTIHESALLWTLRGRIWDSSLDFLPAMRTSIDTYAVWEYDRILAVPSVKWKTIQLYILSLNAVFWCFFGEKSLVILLVHWTRWIGLLTFFFIFFPGNLTALSQRT